MQVQPLRRTRREALILTLTRGSMYPMKNGRRWYCCFAAMVVAFAHPGMADEELIAPIKDGIIRPHGAYTILTYEAPAAMRIVDTGLREAGLAVGQVILQSDEIRVFENRDVTESAPMARLWLNGQEGGAYWFILGGKGSAMDFVIPKGAMVVVWTRAGKKPVTWQNVFE